MTQSNQTFKMGPNQKRFIQRLKSTKIPQGRGRLMTLTLEFDSQNVEIVIKDEMIAGACCLGLDAYLSGEKYTVHRQRDLIVARFGRELFYATDDTQDRLKLFSENGRCSNGHSRERLIQMVELVEKLSNKKRPHGFDPDNLEDDLGLADLNDNWKLTFPQIAQVIESYPEFFFKEPA